MRIYMVRHGQTNLNVRGCYYGSTDADLSEEGKRQAERLRDLLSEVDFDHILASPLQRAAETARIIVGEDAAGKISYDERLKEHDFGCFEGLTYKEIGRDYPEELAAWNADYAGYRIPGGESFLDVRKRVDAFRADLAGKEGTMLVVAHKGTFGHLLALMLGMDPDGYWNFVFDQDCYSVVDLEDGYAIIRKLNTDSPAR